jgi:hypothetical protein
LEIAQHLAEQSVFPQEESLNLLKVAEYFSLNVGRENLQSTLHDLFDRDFPLAPVHEFLADISTPLLVVTTNYDDLIERAFRQRGQAYDVVIHANDPSLGEIVLWWPYGATYPEKLSPNRLDIDLNLRSVIYKMNGSVDRQNAQLDQYVVTEDDHIEFLTRLSRGKAVPALFAELFVSRPFLFLGYGLNDWHVRVLLYRLIKDYRRYKGLRSWSIQHNPSALEQVLWQQRGAEVYAMTLDHFIEQLQFS